MHCRFWVCLLCTCHGSPLALFVSLCSHLASKFLIHVSNPPVYTPTSWAPIPGDYEASPIQNFRLYTLYPGTSCPVLMTCPSNTAALSSAHPKMEDMTKMRNGLKNGSKNGSCLEPDFSNLNGIQTTFAMWL